MSARLAVHLPPHQLPELQQAARALLRSPLLTARDGEFRAPFFEQREHAFESEFREGITGRRRPSG